MTQPVPRQDQSVEDWAETWQLVGAAIFGVGLLALTVLLVPLILGTAPLPLAVQVLGLLAPVGALVGLVGPALVRRRQR